MEGRIVGKKLVFIVSGRYGAIILFLPELLIFELLLRRCKRGYYSYQGITEVFLDGFLAVYRLVEQRLNKEHAIGYKRGNNGKYKAYFNRRRLDYINTVGTC